MTGLQIDARDRTTILVHYYRAMVGRADIWRTRMDTTTHWAIGATAAVISFTFGNASVPHYVVYIASLMTLSFLVLEARRLTFYHLWQQRVLLIENALIRPAVSADPAGDEVDLGLALDVHLGRTAPSMPLSKAVARRLRRVYLYLFGVQLIAWVLKLSSHPDATSSLGGFIARAQLGAVPGVAVMGATFFLFAAAAIMGFVLGGIDRSK